MKIPTFKGARNWGAAGGTVLMLCRPLQALAYDFRNLSDTRIKRLISGSVLTDDVHYRDHFMPGGKYEGVSMSRSFSGTWEVKDGELCITRASENQECDEIWQSPKDATQVELRVVDNVPCRSPF